MSTRVRLGSAAKKISSWVRPGVLEVRASACRPVSALIRLDLPTLERPANAISTPRIAGSEVSDPAAVENCQSAANSFRPASISARVKAVESMLPLTTRAGRQPHYHSGDARADAACRRWSSTLEGRPASSLQRAKDRGSQLFSQKFRMFVVF